MKRFLIPLLLITQVCSAQTGRWPVARANEWYAGLPWLTGCNFQPSTAINQLEMFQSATFDTATISKELGWAHELGFNVMRVYLHHLLWASEKEAFKKNLDTYLRISQGNGIRTIFVFFDDCWNDTARVGSQPSPKPGVHNSGWLRDPGTMIYTNPDTVKVLELYVKDVLTTFKNDSRILMWDLYNEPGGNYQFEKSFPLLRNVFRWAREAGPSQPVTAGVWINDKEFGALNRFQLENSDVITYHNYAYVDEHANAIDTLSRSGRPVICTEYMARRNGSIFQVIMPLLKSRKIGAINWGFVSGKTNTIYAWDKVVPDGSEPPLWFHDILRKDGTPFSRYETEFIKKINGR